MQNGKKTFRNVRQSRRPASFAVRSRPANTAHPDSRISQNARRNYEKYLALARTEAQSGNAVGAENYYQYAEHYYRSMSSDPEST
jgi:hypothetical protein